MADAPVELDPDAKVPEVTVHPTRPFTVHHPDLPYLQRQPVSPAEHEEVAFEE